MASYVSVPGNGPDSVIDVDDPEPVEMPDTSSSPNNNEGDKEEKFEPSTVVRKMKGSSVCWDFLYFKGSKTKGADKSKVFCKLCSAVLPYNNSTSNLVDHFKRHHKKDYDKAESKKLEENNNKQVNKISNYLGPNPGKIYKWPKTSPKWKNTTQQMAKWLCTASRPSKIVEDKGFIDLMAILAPEYEVPCDQTMTDYIRREYEVRKKALKEKLTEIDYCALTSDGGSSLNAVSFQDTNVHYIDEDIYLQTHTLGVKENKEKHTAVNYRENTDKLTDEFDITEKVVLNVTDNEAKMKLAFQDDERGGCVSHLIHSSVSNAMAKVEVVDKITKKVRKVAKRHNKSYAFRYGLQVQQRKRGIKVKPLSQDVPTRWGSTRASTASFLDSREKDAEDKGDSDKTSDMFGGQLDTFENADAINAALRDLTFKNKDEKDSYLLTRSDMLKIKNLNSLLTKLDVYSTTLGGSKFVTSSIVLPVIKSLQKHLEADADDPSYISEMKELILEDFKQRIASNLNFPMLLKATALDPRFKNLKAVENKEMREEVFVKLEKEMKDLRKGKECSAKNSDVQITKKRKLGIEFDESSDEDDTDFDEIKKEVDDYKREALQDRNEDPLDWWRMRRAKYPHLLKMVKKYLCIPATSTQAERVFSALGNLLTKRRLCMSGENVDAQLFLKDNWRD